MNFWKKNYFVEILSRLEMAPIKAPKKASKKTAKSEKVVKPKALKKDDLKRKVKVGRKKGKQEPNDFMKYLKEVREVNMDSNIPQAKLIEIASKSFKLAKLKQDFNYVTPQENQGNAGEENFKSLVESKIVKVRKNFKQVSGLGDVIQYLQTILLPMERPELFGGLLKRPKGVLFSAHQEQVTFVQKNCIWYLIFFCR